MAKRTFTKYPSSYVKASTEELPQIQSKSDMTKYLQDCNYVNRAIEIALEEIFSDDEEYEFTSKAKLYDKVYSTFVNELWARAKDGIFLLPDSYQQGKYWSWDGNEDDVLEYVDKSFITELKKQTYATWEEEFKGLF